MAAFVSNVFEKYCFLQIREHGKCYRKKEGWITYVT